LDAVLDETQQTSTLWVRFYNKAQIAAIQSAVRRGALSTHSRIRELRPQGLVRDDYNLLIQFAGTFRILTDAGPPPRSSITPKKKKDLRRVMLLAHVSLIGAMGES
jgi:hypothetical protein